MKIKIRGGTAREDDASLCLTCKWSTIVRGQRLRDEIVRCGQLDQPITFHVTSCTRFVDRQHPAIHEMEEMAWILRTDAKRNRVGFVQAKKLSWTDRHVIDED